MGNRYFMDLKYSLGDEDAAVESGILPERARHVMAVAGSGARVIPLLARHPQKLTCVDTQDEQLALTELRIEALRRMDHSQYVAFMGYQSWSMKPAERQACFEDLPLSRQTREYLGVLSEGAEWGPFVYLGNYERSLGSLSRTIRRFLGERGIKIFEFENQKQQLEYFEKEFPKRRWGLVLHLMAFNANLNAIIYKGVYPKRNRRESTYAIFKKTFTDLICDRLARKSFYLQLMFLGEIIHQEGNPLECDAAIYERAAAGARAAKIDYLSEDVVEAIDKTVDFVSLSDVPSYFNDPRREKSFMQDMGAKLKPGAIVVYRGHLHLADPDLTDYNSLSDKYAALFEEEKTRLWQFFAFQKQ